MHSFTENTISVIKHIPPGKVMTYGQIAKVAGNPGGARQVARILHSMSRKYQLPWHRVVNAQGRISLMEEESFQEQKLSLEAEGVKLIGGKKVNLAVYQHEPD